MRILFNNNVLSGLLSFREDVINHFIDCGHEVVLVAPPEQDANIQKRLPLQAKYIPVRIYNGSVNPLNDIKYFRDLKRIFAQERPDYVFNYTAKPVIYGSLVCKLLGIQNTAMLPGLGYTFIKNSLPAKIGFRLYRYAMKYPEHLLFLNKENIDTVTRIKFCDPKKIIWLKGGEGVNLNKYVFTDNTSDNTIFLFIARLLKEKGYHEFVAAAREVKTQYPDVRFLVAGGLSLNSPDHVTEQELNNDIEEGFVEYLGNVNDMMKLYKTPGVVVAIPSYYSEGLNRSLMEACSAGKPIITTDKPGCRETVIDEQNGYIVGQRDVNSLVSAMIRYIGLPAGEKKSMSLASRKLAEEEFDVKKVIAVYDAIINGVNH